MSLNTCKMRMSGEFLTLTCKMLWADSADDKLMIFFVEKRIWHFMQIVSFRRSSRSFYLFSLHATSLSRNMVMCTAPVCREQCSMPVRLGHWQSQTSNICSGMTGQWSDRSAMSGRKTLSPPGPLSYLHDLALRIWTSFWRREGSAGMDMWNAPMVQSRQPFTYRLRESVGLGGPKWHGISCREGLQRVEALGYQPSW